MATYRISGIWTNIHGTVTHYALHETGVTTPQRARKVDKAEAVRIVGNPYNTTMTWLWDYTNCRWKDGAKVEPIAGSYLRSYHDGKVSDNLSHLINYGWIMP